MSVLPGRGRPTERQATASGARANRLQSRRYHRRGPTGEGYLELAVDISKFSYFARRGLWSILDRIKNFSIHAAFVLEGTVSTL